VTARILAAMCPGARSRSSWFVSAAALVGVVLGHPIAYRIAFPDPIDRRAVLAHSGHGYWFAAVMLAVGCAVLAGSGTVFDHVRRALGRRSPAPTASTMATALRLAAIQSALFVGQEVLERLRAGEHLSSFGRGGFLLVGIAVQIAVAVAIAVVLKLLGRTAEAIALVIAPRRRAGRRADRRIPERTVALLTRTSEAPLGPRAPPLPAIG
jgi:hypothetical protein